MNPNQHLYRSAAGFFLLILFFALFSGCAKNEHVKKDPSFEYIIACGLGGIYTEVIKDIGFKICPITKQDAEDLLKKLKTYPILKGARNYKPANINKIIDILLKVSKLSQKHKNIRELDINPLIANIKEVKIVDALITLEDS